MVIPRILTLSVVIVVVTGVSAAAHGQATSTSLPYRSVQAGVVAKASAQSMPSAAAPATGLRAKGARRIPRVAGARSATPRAVATDAAPAALRGRLETNFNGVSSRDSEVTNFNAEFEPPDQGLCEGNGFVVEPVNSAYSIYTTSGRLLRGPFNVNDLFDEGAAEFTSDPRCYYDASTNTWFATILFLNSSFTRGRLDVAVSTSGDPTGPWRQYRFDNSELGGNGCPCFGDQPRLGIDQHNLYVTTDEFSINGPQFDGAEIYAIAKTDLVAGAASAHFVHYTGLTIDGVQPTAPQPALSSGKPAAEYFLNSFDLTGTSDNRIGVWALSHGERVATGGMPTLTSTVVTSEPYGLPPGAVQKHSSSLLDSGDDRMQQTQFIGGQIWGELTTAISVPGDPVQRAGAAWFAVRPSLTNGRLSGASIARQGYVAAAGRYVIYPALQADAAGRAAMVFTTTGSSLYPSAGYAVLPSSGTRFGPIRIAGAGTGPYDPNATRWGDYSWAVLDPDADSAWLATEYVPPKASQTSTRERNWGTRVFEVALS